MLSLTERLGLLRGVTLFTGLTPEDLQQLATRLVEVSLDRGAAVFRAGDPGDSLFIVLRGKVAIRDGQRHLVTLATPECFGELAVLSQEARSADAICEDSCELLKLRAADLRELLASRPALQHQMMLALVRRVKETGDRKR